MQLSGAAVRVTDVSSANVVEPDEQSVPQSMPAGLLVTRPVPCPAFVRVSLGLSSMALTGELLGTFLLAAHDGLHEVALLRPNGIHHVLPGDGAGTDETPSSDHFLVHFSFYRMLIGTLQCLNYWNVPTLLQEQN